MDGAAVILYKPESPLLFVLVCVFCYEGQLLHGPPILVDKTNFGLEIYNQANFYRFEETPSYWLVKKIRPANVG